MQQTKIGMPLAEFLRRMDEQRFELIDGEIWDMTPTKRTHSRVSKRIYDKIMFFLVDNPIGDVFFETTFITEDRSDWVIGSRIPDVSFYEETRLVAYEEKLSEDDNKPFILVPDLVVEVISPTDKYQQIDKKVRFYLADGVKLIWLITPEDKVVTVYDGSINKRIDLGINDKLSGSNVLPNFEIELKDLFK